MRERVRDFINEPLPQHGVNQYGGDNVTSTNDNERGNSATYAIRRLKRDRPDLAEKVIKGELTANKAAQEAD